MTAELLKLAYDYSVAAYDRPNIHIDSTSAEALVEVHEPSRTLVIAFKGSREWLDWVNDFRVLPTKYRGAWCHRGFAKAHDSIWQDVLNYVFSAFAANQYDDVLLAGHSLGGAMAELSVLARPMYRRSIHLITFGKPNVFLKPRAARFPWLATQLSVVHGSDAVARRPRLMYGPDLGQTMLYLSNGGVDFTLAPGDKAGDYTLAELLAADGRLRDAASDHSLEEYGARLKPHFPLEKPDEKTAPSAPVKRVRKRAARPKRKPAAKPAAGKSGSRSKGRTKS